MKVGAFTMVTDPDHRQDPWREGIAQMIEVFDAVVVVCGREKDIDMIRTHFKNTEGKLFLIYLDWPQPEWSYDELPKHLNLGLQTLRDMGCDWAVRLDIDTCVHEQDKHMLKCKLGLAMEHGQWVASFEKYQFVKPGICYEKGKVPLAVRLTAPIAYGFDRKGYGDLCQPIIWDGKTMLVMNKPPGPPKEYDIPIGERVPQEKVFTMRAMHVWNYDYTFKTKERATELLFQFDKAHERFWGQGYSGLKGPEITPESALADFLVLQGERWKRMIKPKELSEHPKHFQQSLGALSCEQFGFDLWDKSVQ
jgi:hypothetical protein